MTHAVLLGSLFFIILKYIGGVVLTDVHGVAVAGPAGRVREDDAGAEAGVHLRHRRAALVVAHHFLGRRLRADLRRACEPSPGVAENERKDPATTSQTTSSFETRYMLDHHLPKISEACMVRVLIDESLHPV